MVHANGQVPVQTAVAAGCHSIEETVRCASFNGAQLFGIKDLGLLVPGMPATFIAVKGDPDRPCGQPPATAGRLGKRRTDRLTFGVASYVLRVARSEVRGNSCGPFDFGFVIANWSDCHHVTCNAQPETETTIEHPASSIQYYTIKPCLNQAAASRTNSSWCPLLLIG